MTVHQDGGVIFISLSSNKYPGKHVVIDIGDWALVSRFSWHPARVGPEKFYATAYDPQSKRAIKMHRVILGLHDSSVLCDHIDGNTLNNCRANLRAVTCQQNSWNRSTQCHSSSRYLGVSWRKNRGHWKSVIYVEGRDVYLGSFKSEEDAARAHDVAALKYHGEFAKLNFQEEAE